ncbi:MAG: acyltransferase [Pseudomonadota bacterium]
MLLNVNRIRALSCIAIALFHIGEFINGNYEGVRIDIDLAGPGFHLFLLISGFILVYITKPTDNPINCFSKRMIRIIPLYWLMTTIALMVTMIWPWSFRNADISIGSVLASYLFLPHADLSGEVMPILFVGWTLNYMMLFYALFATTLLLPARFQVVGAIVGLSAIMALASLLPEGSAAAFYADPILTEFAAGCVLGILLRQPSVIAWIKRTPMWPMAVLGGAGLIFAMLADADGWLEVAYYIFPASLLLFASVGVDLYRTQTKPDVLSNLGLISYGIYLIHPFAILLVGMIVVKLNLPTQIAIPVIFAGVSILTLILAHYARLYVELPSNDWLRKKLVRRERIERLKMPVQQ